jgi:hypothetical protein
MASGQALLQRLQARRLPASNSNNEIIDSGNKRSLPIRNADLEPPLPAPDATTIIEICQGPDCAGLGGGAALLEIEELVCEHDNNNNNGANKPVLVVGACRDFCTVGPNVHIRRKRSTMHGQQFVHHEHSLNHVDNPSRCADVVDSLTKVGDRCGGAAHTSTARKESHSLVARMAQRRSERLRWEALRQVSRTSSSAQQQQRRSDGATTTTTTTTTSQDGTPQESTSLTSSSSTAVAVPLQVPVLDTTATTATGATRTAMTVPVYKSNDAIQELLQAATRAEMDAAGSNSEMRARAQRRSERLFRKMQ